VKSITRLEKEVLPHYYKHNNFQSLVRQLNMYDFHKTRTKEKEKEFKHESFIRGQPELLINIKRKLGDEPIHPTNRAASLIQKTKELEERLQTLKSLASLAMPLQTAKTLPLRQSELLLDGLLSYLEPLSQDSSDEVAEATQEYVTKLKNIFEKNTSNSSKNNKIEVEVKGQSSSQITISPPEEKKCSVPDETSSLLGKRLSPSWDGDTCPGSNSEDEFTLDPLDRFTTYAYPYSFDHADYHHSLLA